MSEEIRNRIVDHAEADPRDITPNPDNWRRHPDVQRRYVDGALREVGWVREPIVNRTTGRLIDGHLRVEQAIAAGESAIPVAYVELTAREEQIALATHDAITANAATDDDMLRTLLNGTQAEDEALQELLADLQPEPQADDDDDPDDPEEQEDPVPMTDRFLRPPFSIIDARDDAWADREHQWDQAGVEPGDDIAESPALHELLVTWFSGSDDTVHHVRGQEPGAQVARGLERGTESSRCDLIIATAPQSVDDTWKADLANAASALRDDRFAAVITSPRESPRADERIKDTAAALGWKFYNEAVFLLEPAGGGPLPQAHRTVYVFAHGDPKAATDHLGAVQVSNDFSHFESP